MKDLVSQSANILIVDDEPDLLDIIHDCLVEEFGQVFSARNGHEAQEILKRQNIDAIVTDYRMPGMNGLELIAWAKHHYPLIPIIMLTANRADQIVIDSLKDGVFDIIDKPFCAEIVINRVQNALIYPSLLKLLWDLMSAEYSIPKMEQVAKLPYNEQLKTLNAFRGLIRTRSIK